MKVLIEILLTLNFFRKGTRTILSAKAKAAFKLKKEIGLYVKH